MPSTYTLNNGIELIGTGEQSGTWGDTTNTNFELIDTALDGQVTVTLAAAGTSGAPNTLPISDGSSSNGRNRMVIFNDGADLGATAYVQLTPNDAEKIVYIRNALSGSRSIIVFQGTYSASNDYEIPAGTTAVIYFNGGGAGAVAANVFNNAYFDSLRLGSVSVTAILDEDNMASDSATALATQQSIKAYVDAQVGANNELSEVLANGNTTGGTDIAVSAGDDITFADNSKAIFGAGSDLQIYHDGSNSYIAEGGGGAGTGDIIIKASNFQVQNGGGTLAAIKTFNGSTTELYYAGSKKLATTSTGVDVTGTVTSDALTVDGDGQINQTAGNASTLTFTSNGQASRYSRIKVDTDRSLILTAGVGAVNETPDIKLQTGTATGEKDRLFIDGATGNISFYDTSGTSQAFFWDASAESLGIGTTNPYSTAVIKSVHVHAPSQAQLKLTSDLSGQTATDGADLFLAGNNDLYLWNRENANISIATNATERMRITSSGNVGIGTSSPSSKLDVSGTTRVFSTSGASPLSYWWSGGGYRLAINMTDTASGVAVYNTVDGNAQTFQIAGTERLRIDSSGRVGIGTSSPSYALSVVGLAGTTLVSTITSQVSTGSYIGFFDTTTSTRPMVGAVGNNFSVQTGSVERLRIDSSGNVGIGQAPSTFSGWTVLEVKGGTNGAMLNFEDDTSARVAAVASSSSSLRIQTFVEEPITLETNNSERMRIDSSGNVGIGTTLPGQELHVQAGTGLEADIRISGNGGASSYLDLFHNAGAAGVWNASNTPLQFATNGTERMRIDSSGNVGIGTSSPLRRLDVQTSSGDADMRVYAQGTTSTDDAILYLGIAGTTATSRINFGDGGDADAGRIIYGHSGDYMSFTTAATEAMRIDSSGTVSLRGGTTDNQLQFWDTGGSVERARIGTNGTNLRFLVGSTITPTMTLDSSGNVGIGTSSPQSDLEIQSKTTGTDAVISLTAAGTRRYQIKALTSVGALAFVDESLASERMRIDSSGNLLVGKTGDNAAIAGSIFSSNGDTYLTAEGSRGRVLYLNRLTSDGTIIDLRKDGAPVGSIGSVSGDAYIATGDVGLRFDDGNDILRPVSSTGADQDATINIGGPSQRFKSAYLSGGVYLGGTGAANLLDDYEEGTWTPSFRFGGGTTGQTYTTSPAGYYTKVGNVVSVWGGVEFSNKGTSTGILTITGLPFATANTGNFRHCSNVLTALYTATSFTAVVLAQGSILQTRLTNVTNQDTSVNYTDIQNNTGLFFQVTYETS